MTEAGLALLTQYGIVILMLATFLSCLAVPIPSSLMMLAAGSFAASGDLVLWQTALAALLGAIVGDNAGYLLGRRANGALTTWLARTPQRSHLRQRAEGYMDKWGDLGVFFSRWLVSPLGPYVNFGAGMAALSQRRFALWAALGEGIWVALYIGLGYAFADQLTLVASVLGNASGFLVGAILTLALGRWLWHRAQLRHP